MSNCNILVTGGARGIGAGIIRELAGAGCQVAFCGRQEASEHQELLAGLHRAYGERIRYYQCDVAKAEDRARLLDEVLSDFGSLHILVNNAGVAPLVRADLLEMSQESFERVMKINLEGPFFLTQAVARKLMENRDGGFRCIINIGSVSADYASISRGEYCLSKAAVAMATKLWAVRLAAEGIPVYEIRPGIIQSDMTSGVKEKYDRLIAEGLTLQKRWGMPGDVGRVVRMLAEGTLAYSTGQVINVDGGLTVERF